MKISIVTVCWNNEDTIAATIQSVLSQTHTDIEYIILDGVSTDCTLARVYQYQDSRLKVVSESDQGIYDALNKGIQFATGDIIGFLHADDVYAHNRVLEEVAIKFTKENIEALYGDLVYVDRRDLSAIKRYWRAGDFHKNLFLKGWMPPHPTFFVRRHVYEQYGNFDLTYQISADYDLMMRFLWKHQIPVAYISSIMIQMRLGGRSNRYFRNLIQKSKEDFLIMKKHHIQSPFLVLFLKNILKLSQFFQTPHLQKGT